MLKIEFWPGYSGTTLSGGVASAERSPSSIASKRSAVRKPLRSYSFLPPDDSSVAAPPRFPGGVKVS